MFPMTSMTIASIHQGSRNVSEGPEDLKNVHFGPSILGPSSFSMGHRSVLLEDQRSVPNFAPQFT